MVLKTTHHLLYNSDLFQCGMNWLVGKFFLRMKLEAGISITNLTLEHVAFATSIYLAYKLGPEKLPVFLFRLELLKTKTKQSNILFISMLPEPDL